MKLYFLFFIFIHSIAFSQTDTSLNKFPMRDGKVVYESVIEFPYTQKTTLYSASKKWISDTFTNAKTAIQSEDLNYGQIVGKGLNTLRIKNIHTKQFDSEFSFQIDVKENKCRIRFYNIILVFTALDQTFKEPIDNFANAEPKAKKRKSQPNDVERVNTFNAQYEALIASYKNALDKAVKDSF